MRIWHNAVQYEYPNSALITEYWTFWVTFAIKIMSVLCCSANSWLIDFRKQLPDSLKNCPLQSRAISKYDECLSEALIRIKHPAWWTKQRLTICLFNLPALLLLKDLAEPAEPGRKCSEDIKVSVNASLLCCNCSHTPREELLGVNQDDVSEKTGSGLS